MRISFRRYVIASLALPASVFMTMTVLADPGTGTDGVTPSGVAVTTRDGAQGVARDGFRGVLDIRAAHIALVDNHPNEARRLIIAARAALERASHAEHGGDVAGVGSVAPGLIVVVGQSLFPGSATHLSTTSAEAAKPAAYPHGAEVGFVFDRLLVPVDETENDLDQALSRLDHQQYAAAKKALETAEAGLSVDTVMLYDAVSGRKGK